MNAYVNPNPITRQEKMSTIVSADIYTIITYEQIDNLSNHFNCLRYNIDWFKPDKLRHRRLSRGGNRLIIPFYILVFSPILFSKIKSDRWTWNVWIVGKRLWWNDLQRGQRLAHLTIKIRLMWGHVYTDTRISLDIK